jgi:lysylphosphatidylglycerol synthetase-like protein (DUF2156 family)
MKKHIAKIFLSFAAALIIFPVSVSAQDMQKNLTSLGGFAGYEKASETTASGIVGSIIKIGLSLLGVIFVVLIIYAGYNWMTASGDETKIEKAKETLWRAIIGLIITVSAYAIWAFIFFKFLAAA